MSTEEKVVEGLQLATRRSSHRVLEHHLLTDGKEQQKPPTPSPHNTILISTEQSPTIMDDTIAETIIHFSDDIPSLSLISFSSTTESPSYRDCPATHDDKMVDATSVGRSQRIESHGNESQRFPEPHYQWVRDSSQTLTNDVSLSRHKGFVGKSDTHERIDIHDLAPDSSPMSTRHSHVPLVPTETRPDSSPWITDGVRSRKPLIDGAGDHPRKQPSPSRRHTLSRMKTLPSGKRYVDPRLDKKARKAAYKTATTLFSNERTFIHWIKFAMLLGGLAIVLLNFSGVGARPEMDQELVNRAGRIGQNVGVSLMILCLLCLVYASSTYHWRHLGVAGGKHDARYFDRIGPTLLALGLLVTYAINIVCK